MSPKDENELQHMIHSALSYGHPAAIRFPKGKASGVPLDEKLKVLPLGKGEVLREGKDVIFAFGNMVDSSIKAAERLEKEGISIAVINARFASPLDEELILRFAQPGNIFVTAEEGVIAGGFGSAVREVLDREKKFDLHFKQIGLPVEIYPVAKVDQIKRMYNLDSDGLYKQVKRFYKTTGKKN
jgi:1-deoxy-D-xylulose-5-phosphate synthase